MAFGLGTARAEEKPMKKIVVWDALANREKEADVVSKSDEEWRKELPADAYAVLRHQGTERAFSGRYAESKDDGIYACAACGNHLFDSRTKFESGTGWPSFYQPVDPRNIGTEEDRSWFSVRTEVHCSRCGSHLGHVFPDGPPPTGLRYCMNSVSLTLIPRK
jgi:peptide-methionine (R)-S-oxide reductase